MASAFLGPQGPVNASLALAAKVLCILSKESFPEASSGLLIHPCSLHEYLKLHESMSKPEDASRNDFN